MPEDFVMPKLGHVMEEATVVAWLKQAGDRIAKGEVFLEVETEKAELEVEAPLDGVLVEIVVGPGETVEVGTLLARVEKLENES